jgi:hypothetical protein
MADLGGLLNIFGATPSYASGLLSEEELDAAKSRARANALLQMGQSFYKAGAPRETPGGSALSGIAGALLSGQQAYQGAIKGSLEEKLNEQKIQDALNAKKRQANIQGLISGAFQPAQAGQAAQPAPYLAGAPYGKATPEIPAMPARFDLQAIAPKLMSLGPEGYSALNDLMNAQKAMQGETLTLAPDATLVRMGLGGQPEVLATGAPKPTKPVLSDYVAKAVDVLGLPRKNANEYSDAERAQINAKAQELAKQASTTTTYQYTGEMMPAGKKVIEGAQDVLASAGNRLMAYNQIEASYRPEYSTPMFRGEQEWASLKDKFGTLEPEKQQELTEYSQWKQNSITNINERIKELTGAAMGKEEAERIMSSLPVPGQGIFDGDSPTVFKAKLDNAIQQLKLVEARNAYIVRTGSVSLTDVPLSKMPKIINDKASEIAKQYKLNPENPRDKQLIMKSLSAFFGIPML